jgi:hypothetical protein
MLGMGGILRSGQDNPRFADMAAYVAQRDGG